MSHKVLRVLGWLATCTISLLPGPSIAAPEKICGWFAVGGCYDTLNEAVKFRARVGGDLVDTSNVRYPNFQPNYYCIAEGPFDSRARANKARNRFRSKGVSDAYVKNSC